MRPNGGFSIPTTVPHRPTRCVASGDRRRCLWARLRPARRTGRHVRASGRRHGHLGFRGIVSDHRGRALDRGRGRDGGNCAGLALNLRLILITASIRDLYRGLPWWRVALGAHFASDENWALLLARRAEGREAGYWYLVGAGAGLMVTWISASVAGVALAAAIPEPRALGMDFAFAAAFIAIMRSLWRGRADLLPWSVSACGVAALVMTETLAASWAIIIGGLAGAAIASIRAHD